MIDSWKDVDHSASAASVVFNRWKANMILIFMILIINNSNNFKIDYYINIKKQLLLIKLYKLNLNKC